MENYEKFKTFKNRLKKHKEYMSKSTCDKCYLKFYKFGKGGIDLNDEIGWYGDSGVSKINIFPTKGDDLRETIVDFLNENLDMFFSFSTKRFESLAIKDIKKIKEEKEKLEKILEELSLNEKNSHH